MTTATLATLAGRCFTVRPDYPTPGVTMYDMAPLLADAALRKRVTAELKTQLEGLGATHVLALETRGYFVGAWIADALDLPLVRVRKLASALKTHTLDELCVETFNLEYKQGEAMALPRGSIPARARLIIADDVLATGGTLAAAGLLTRLVQIDSTVVGMAVLLELLNMPGRATFGPARRVALFGAGKDGTLVDLAWAGERPTATATATAADEDDTRAVLMWHPAMTSVANQLLAALPQTLRASPIRWEFFGDGWPSVHFEHRHTLQGRDVVFLASFHDKNLIMEQISLMIAVPRQVIKSFRVFVPYYGPGTMERVAVEGELATAETLAKMCSACLPATQGGPPIITLFDIHALCTRFYFDERATIVLESALSLIKARIIAEHMTVVFPDEGAFKRFYAEFKGVCPVVVCSKTRGEGAAAGERKVIINQQFLEHSYGPGIDPWKQPAIIIDDLAQTGSTLAECAVALRKTYSFSRISAYVTHAVFPNNAHMRFVTGTGRATFDTFYVTNTNPAASAKLEAIGAPFVVLNIVPLLAGILKRALPRVVPVSPPKPASPVTRSVFVCSQSAVKRAAVDAALKQVGDNSYVGSVLVSVPAKALPNQPIGNVEITACMHRRLDLSGEFFPTPGTRLVSIESGIVPVPGSEAYGQTTWQEVTCIGVFTATKAEPYPRETNVAVTWALGPVLTDAKYTALLPQVLAASPPGSVTLGSLLHAADPAVPADAWYNRQELITQALVLLLAKK